jgi:hypothetical protein
MWVGSSLDIITYPSKNTAALEKKDHRNSIDGMKLRKGGNAEGGGR